MEEEKLRLYCFNNMYLSGMQAGIQSLHTAAELFAKYNPNFEKSLSEDIEDKVYVESVSTLYDWVNNHKTVIILNGGMAKDLFELQYFLADGLENNKLPWAYFNESEDALGGVLTNVGIIVPERVYSINSIPQEIDYTFYVANYTAYGDTKLTEFEFELNKRIKRCRLMN